MRTFTRLQQLNLTDKQWEDILPKPKVPKLTALVREAYRDGYIADATIVHEVDEQVKFITFKVLLMLYVEAALAGCRDCNICLQDETSNLQELHTFHGKCIAKWFGRSSTCPMC